MRQVQRYAAACLRFDVYADSVGGRRYCARAVLRLFSPAPPCWRYAILLDMSHITPTVPCFRFAADAATAFSARRAASAKRRDLQNRADKTTSMIMALPRKRRVR